MEENKSSVASEGGLALSSIIPRGKECIGADAAAAFEACIASVPSIQLELISVLPGVYYIDNVLSQDECSSLIYLIDASSALSFWCADKQDDASTRSYRNAETIEMHSQLFAHRLWDRISHVISSNLPNVEIPDDPEDESYERDLVGCWKACGTNPDALFARYLSNGSFAPHTDGRAIIDFNTRSHYSIILFLNSVAQECGAGTRFYSSSATQHLQLLPDQHSNGCTEQWTADKSFLQAEVPAVAGRLLLFQQAWVHEGAPPVHPFTKHILRSDIIFQRDPAICNSSSDKEAYCLFREAEVLAEGGQTGQAISLFRRAFRLSPLLAQIMGQA